MEKYNNTNTRNGCADIWNAFMAQNASFSENDIPLCPTTAASVPQKLIGYDEAKAIHKAKHLIDPHYKVDAFIHFYIDDQKFDGKQSSIWLYPQNALDIIKHFSGIISPDFSTYTDFPKPLKIWNVYRMCLFGYWISTQGIPVISNVRWGTKETWDYCFDGNPKNSVLAIGTVASGIRLLKNRPIFEDGLSEMVSRLSPHTLIVYGSDNNDGLLNLKHRGINIYQFPSRTSLAFERGV